MSSFGNFSNPLILTVNKDSNNFVFNRAQRAWKLLISWIIDEYNNIPKPTLFIKENFPVQLQPFVIYLSTEGLLDLTAYRVSFPVQLDSYNNFIPKANPPERTAAGTELITLGLDKFSEIIFSIHTAVEEEYREIELRANDEYYIFSSKPTPVPPPEVAQAHQRYLVHIDRVESEFNQVKNLSLEVLTLANEVKSSCSEQDLAHFLNQTTELENEYNSLISKIYNYRIPKKLIIPYILRISTEKRIEAYKNFIRKKTDHFREKANTILLPKIKNFVEATNKLISLYSEAQIKGILLPEFSSGEHFSEEWFKQLSTRTNILINFEDRFSSSSIGRYEEKFLKSFRYHWISPKALKQNFTKNPLLAFMHITFVIAIIIVILVSVSTGTRYITKTVIKGIIPEEKIAYTETNQDVQELNFRSTPISKTEKSNSTVQESFSNNSSENASSTLFRAPVLYIQSDKIKLNNKTFSISWAENPKVSNLLSAKGYRPPFPMIFYDRHYTDHSTGKRKLVPLQVFNEDEIDLPLGESQPLEIDKKNLSSLSTLPKGSFIFLGSSLPTIVGGALEQQLDQNKTLPTLSNTSICMVFTEAENTIVSAFLSSYKELEESHYSSLDLTIETELELLFAVTHIAVYWPDLYNYSLNHTELFTLIPDKTNTDEFPYHEVTKHIGGQYDGNDGKLVVRFLSNSTIAGTAIHEFGHMYHHRFLSEKYENALQAHYDELVESKSNSFITDYSKTNFHEFFAENFEAFTLNPGKLKRTDEYLYGIFQNLSQEVQKQEYIIEVQS